MKRKTLEEGRLFRLKFSPSLHRDGTRAPDLIDVILQGANTNRVLFLGSMDEKAWQETQRTKKVVLYSRSRKELWYKGKTSGSELEVVEIHINCEQTTLLLKVRLLGQGVCHTKDEEGRYRQSCFYRKLKKGKLIHIV